MLFRSPGKLADLVILERDPLQVEPTSLGTIKVVQTIKEGQPIFRLGIDRLDTAAAQAASGVAADPEQAERRMHGP